MQRRPFGRVYGFKDVVGLRTLALLRNQHHVHLQELKKFGAWPSDRHRDPRATLRFYVSGRRAIFRDPDDDSYIAGRPPGQTVFPVYMSEIERDVESAARKLRERQPSEIGSVVRNRYVVSNAPVLAGIRIPTSAVWNLHQAGYDTATIIREYPRLTPEDVKAAILDEELRRNMRAS